MISTAVHGRHGHKDRHRNAGDGALVLEEQRRPLAEACMPLVTAPSTGRSRSSSGAEALVAAGPDGDEAHAFAEGGCRGDDL